MMPGIRWAMRLPSTKVLGPYERAVLWVHGCCFDCKGCIAQQYKKGPFQTASPASMAEWFFSTNRQHLTISGGEPFLQAEALSIFLKKIHARMDAGIIIYSGFTYEELMAKSVQEPGTAELLSHTDILIDGRYEQALDDGRPYIGSANQRMILLSPRYHAEAESYYRHAKGRRIELKLDARQTVMTGVPSKEQKYLWEHLKRLADQ